MNIIEYVPMQLPNVSADEYSNTIIVCDTEKMTNSEWLLLRKKYLGASSSGIVMGVSPYQTIYSLYDSLTSTQSVDIDNSTEAIQFMHGHLNEPICAEMFRRATNFEVHEETRYFASTDDLYYFIGCTPDYICKLPCDTYFGKKGEIGLVECKCPNAYHLSDHWGSNENPIVPDVYYAQAQQQMAVMNLNYCFFAVKYGNTQSDFCYRLVLRDERYIEELFKRLANFWYKHLQKGVKPTIEDIPIYQGKILKKEIEKEYQQTTSTQTISVRKKDIEIYQKTISEIQLLQNEIEKKELFKDCFENTLKTLAKGNTETTFCDENNEPFKLLKRTQSKDKETVDLEKLKLILTPEQYSQVVSSEKGAIRYSLSIAKRKKNKK